MKIEKVINQLTAKKTKFDEKLTQDILKHQEELEKFHDDNADSDDEGIQQICCRIEKLLEFAGVEGYEFS